MARIAYLDCFSGISGNMLLGALLDCGLPQEEFRAQLNGLAVTGYRLDVREVHASGLRALHINVQAEAGQPHRHPADVHAIIEKSKLPARVKRTAQRVFQRLAEAEAKVHGEPAEQIHFHEVGAVDALVDIVGSVLCLEMLGVEKVICSPLPQGRGVVASAHGILPVPAPATSELLRGVPIYGKDVEAELVTPTGAALAVSLAAEFGPLPALRVDRIGCGAGTRDLPWANILRVFLGDAEENGAEGVRTIEVAANIDDMNPEWYEHAMERLFAAGALDVFLIPIQMKHNRPAAQLGFLVEEPRLEETLGVLFAETTTIGVRMYPVERRKLDREMTTVATEYGDVSVKVARWKGRVMNIAPEYRDCLRIAQERNVPIKKVYEAAMESARKSIKE